MRVPDAPRFVAMTPAATPYDTMTAADVCIVTLDGEVVDGDKPPTSELPLHTLVYGRRPEVGAIVHAHSPAAMATNPHPSRAPTDSPRMGTASNAVTIG